MNMVNSLALRRWLKIIAANILAASLILEFVGCPPVTLKTIQLKPTQLITEPSGGSGSKGYCLGPGNPPLAPFSPGSGQVLVGFWDFFQPGAPPLPCDHLTAENFRACVIFDVSQFDTITSANLLFDTQSSVTGAKSDSPPNSYATTLCIATQDFANTPSPAPCNNEASLPTGTSIDVGVSSQVRDWITKKVTNFGFVLEGPRGPIDFNNPPEDNDAKLSFYGNFRLQIVYNPAQNPRAPQ
jgi:hypothetical protein